MSDDPEDDWDTYISPATGLAGWNIESVQVAITITDGTPLQPGATATLHFESAPTPLVTVATFGVTQALTNFSQTWTSNPALGSFNLFASISSDGILNYTVERTAGNGFTLTNTALTVVANNDVLAVPDGGTTLAMLGLGMVGLGALRRKLGV